MDIDDNGQPVRPFSYTKLIIVSLSIWSLSTTRNWPKESHFLCCQSVTVIFFQIHIPVVTVNVMMSSWAIGSVSVEVESTGQKNVDVTTDDGEGEIL